MRAAHEIGNQPTETEDRTDPATGHVAAITRLIADELRVLLNVHTTVFAATTFKDIDITGFNVHLQDRRVPGSAAAGAERRRHHPRLAHPAAAPTLKTVRCNEVPSPGSLVCGPTPGAHLRHQQRCHRPWR